MCHCFIEYFLSLLQNTLWARNCLAVVAVALAKLECAGDIEEQMRLLTGRLGGDQDQWRACFPPLLVNDLIDF